MIWTDRPTHKFKERFTELLAYILLAFAVGTIAFVMSKTESLISSFTNENLDSLVVQRYKDGTLPPFH